MEKLEEFDCSICLSLMIEPAQLPCKHYLCFSCAQDYLIYNNTCPYCREPIKAGFKPKIDVEKQNAVKIAAPDMYKERTAELKEMREIDTNKIKLVVQYGNTCEKVPDKNHPNKHKWKVFVRLANQKDDIKKYIKKVTIGLDESFGITSKDLLRPPFEF